MSKNEVRTRTFRTAELAHNTSRKFSPIIRDGQTRWQSNTLDFQISAAGLTLASFQACSSCTDTAFFFADVIAGNGNTGLIDATSGVPSPIAGAGLPGPVLASGILLVLARRRRQIA